MSNQVPVLSNQRVLVVEEDEGMAERIQMGLEAWGYGVVIAYDPIEAMRLSTAAPFDAVVLDLGVDATGGLMLLTALRNRHASEDVPVIALSSTTRASAAALHRGAFLCVPRNAVTPSLMAQVIREVTSDYLPSA